MAYATLAELKNRVNITSADVTRDTVLTALLSAAERAINGYCNRPDGFLSGTAAARYFAGSGKPYQRIDECSSISAVAVKDSASDDEGDYTAWTLGTLGTTLSADVFAASGDPEAPDYNTTPYNLLVIGPNGSYSLFPSGRFVTRGGFRPSSGTARGVAVVKVTAAWGYAATVPANVKEACVLQAARWWKRSESSWADSVASADLGQLMFRQALDPDLKAMLTEARLVRPAVGRR